MELSAKLGNVASNLKCSANYNMYNTITYSKITCNKYDTIATNDTICQMTVGPQLHKMCVIICVWV